MIELLAAAGLGWVCKKILETGGDKTIRSTCAPCHGRGYVYGPEGPKPNVRDVNRRCDRCDGTGTVYVRI